MSMTKIRDLQPPPIKFGAQSGACCKPGLASGPSAPTDWGGPYRYKVGFRVTPRILLTARGKICNNPRKLQPAEQHGREMEVAHHLSNSQSRTASSRAQSTLQIADKLVSPSSILFSQRNRPPGLRPSHVRAVSDDMDRRHPSSFQQLEKVCLHWTYQTES